MAHRIPRRADRGALAKVLPLGDRGRVPHRASLPMVDPESLSTERAIAEMAACITESAVVAQAQRAQLGIVQELFRARACFLVEYVPRAEQLQVVIVRGRNDRRIAAARPGRGPIGRAFSEKRVVREGALAAAPLWSLKAVTGCLVLLAPARTFSDELLAALAAQVSAASEVGRLRDEAMRRNKDLQTAISGLKSLEKNRESLLANVSHDLKNPLTTIKAYLNLLEKGRLGQTSKSQLEALRVCERNANRLLRMIDDLLLISRLQHGRMQLHERPFGLKSLAEEVVHVLSPAAEQAGVRLTIVPCTEAYARGDRARIAEAISSLIENAIQHSPPGKAVEIKVTSDAAGLAILSVTDQGSGIAEGSLEHIFDPYHRARTPHGGQARSRSLGLPLAARIVQLHGGRITVTSKAGEGASFHIHLPVFAAAVARAEVSPGPGAGGILLVEDDADCREVLHQVLQDAGYPVVSTPSMAAAIEALPKLKPAMVLLDLMLSDGDGRSVLHLIRETPSLSNTRVFIISGSSEVSSLLGRPGKDRIDGVFEKPLRLPELLNTVSSVVHPVSPRPGDRGQ